MSRNSKNYTRLVAARAISAIRVGGGSGPTFTPSKHGKDRLKRFYSVHSRTAPKQKVGAR